MEPPFGTWFMANENIEAALSFAGYDVQHAWGVHGHDGGPGNVILPDVLRWLWRGWPAPIEAGRSENDMLAAILKPGEGWQRVEGPQEAVAGLASGLKGEVAFSDTKAHLLYRIGSRGGPEAFSSGAPDICGAAFGRDGTLYATVPSAGEILAFDAQGAARKVAEGIRGSRILVTAAGSILVTEPGAHSDEPSTIWQLGPDGARSPLDRGLPAASGIAFSPDGNLLFAAGSTGNRVYSCIAADGRLQDGEPFLLAARRRPPARKRHRGACGRHRGQPLRGDPHRDIGLRPQRPRPGYPPASLPERARPGPLLGGSTFDTLYATDGSALYRRRLRIPGYPQWSAPVELPKSNAG